MKKVLILAYDFPPYVSVGGLRPYSWFRYFHEFGVYPIVVTRQWGNVHGNHLDYVAPSETDDAIIEESEQGTIIRIPYSPNLSNRMLLKYGEKKYVLLRKLISAFYEFSELVMNVGPKYKMLIEAEKYLQKNSADMIIATGNPFVLFKYAFKLSKAYKIPWIADYRDPWSQDPKRSRNIFLRKWDLFFEKKYTSHASFITTVSEYFKNMIQSVFPKSNFEIIANGYDPDVFDSIKDVKQSTEKLSVGFSGTIASWIPLEGFMRVVDSYVRDNPEKRIEFNFYGVNVEQRIRELVSVEFPELQKIFNIYPKLTNNELVRQMAKNNALLLFTNYATNGTKIYDYLALKRKIIFCYSDDEESIKLKSKYYYLNNGSDSNQNIQIDMINLTNAGIVVKDSKHLVVVLDQVYNEFVEHSRVKCDSINIDSYSRKVQAKMLADVIKNFLNKCQVK